MTAAAAAAAAAAAGQADSRRLREELADVTLRAEAEADMKRALAARALALAGDIVQMQARAAMPRGGGRGSSWGP